MAHFFDTLTEMAEMTIFFLLGLLVTPARLPQMLLPGLALMAFMLYVSRPIAVGVLLAPFKTNPPPGRARKLGGPARSSFGRV